MKNIPNPYSLLGLPEEKIVRIQADVSIDDRNLLRTVCPEQGVYTFVIANLLIKISNELRNAGITDFSRESDFRNAVTNCKIHIGGLSNGPASGPLPNTTPSDVGTGVEVVRNGTASVANEPSNVPFKDGEKREQRRGKGPRGVRDGRTKKAKSVE